MGIIRALFHSGLDPTEILRAHDVLVHLADLGPDVAAFTYRSRKGRLHVFINRNRNPVDQAKSFLHELHHFNVDMPGGIPVLSLDALRHEREVQAERFARKTWENYVVS